MPIEFACVCGRRFEAKDGGGGRAFRCPACSAGVTAPADAWPGLAIDVTPRGPARPRPGRRSPTGPGVGGFACWLACLAGLALAGLGLGVLERAWEVNGGWGMFRTRAQADAEAAREWPRLKAEADRAVADMEARRAAPAR